MPFPLAALAIGAGIGALSGASTGAIERWATGDDVINAGDIASDAGLGALFGGFTGGAGGALGGIGGRYGARTGIQKIFGRGSAHFGNWMTPASGKFKLMGLGSGGTLRGLGVTAGVGGMQGLSGRSQPADVTGITPMTQTLNPFLRGALEAKAFQGPTLEESLGLTDADLFGTGRGGAMSDIPVFTRSYDDYLRSPILRDFANKEIINQNAAIVRANQDLRRNMGQEIDAAEAAGANVQANIRDIQNTRKADHASARQHLASEQKENRLDVERMINRLSAGITDDTARDNVARDRAVDIRDEERANRADREFLGDIGNTAADELAMINAAEGQATRAEVRGTRQDYMNQILDNRAQARDNWKARPSLIQALADTAIQRDMQGYGQFLSGWQSLLNANASMRNTDQSVRLQRAQLLADAQSGPDVKDQIALWNYYNQPYGPVFTGEGPEGTNTEMKYQQTLGDHLYNSTGATPFSGYRPPNELWFNGMSQ